MDYNKTWVIVPTVILFAFVYHVACESLVLTSGHSIRKRSIHYYQLCRLVSSLQPEQPCYQYRNYGCFCGWEGTGATPVDSVDHCCMEHDACYNSCSYWYYSYHCNGTECQCTDNPEQYPCHYANCQCDLKLAECLRDAEYHDYYYDYNQQLCSNEIDF